MTLLCLLALAIYLFTRLYHLQDFPIYFYSDEASPALTAADLLKNGLRDQNQVFLPTFFWNDRKFSLGTTVYLQALPLIFLPRSIFLTRLVTVLFGVLGFYWLVMILLDIYKLRHGWIGAFLFISTPAWFLFSRLGIETPIFTVFYTGFFYYYLRYRLRNPRQLFIAILLGALAFYTYFPGQIIILVTGLLWLISDWKYHLQHWKINLAGAGIIFLCAIPLFRFVTSHPDYYLSQMQEYGILSREGISFLTALTNYLSRYMYGLSPVYWFSPVPHDPIWWVMKGYSHISWLLLPFFIWGFVCAVKGWRRPEMRVILASFLAGPAGSALISIEITRVLAMIIPSLVLITLGISAAFDWLQHRKLYHPSLVGLGAVVLTIVPFAMLYDVLHNAPTWFTNYGISGLQWGSKEVYQAANEINKKEPDTKIYVSDGWNWQPYTMHRFFVEDGLNIISGNADMFMDEYLPGLESSLFIMVPSGYEKVSASNKFAEVKVERIINTPDGNPGFYIVRLRYREDAQALFKAELQERAELVSDLVMLGNVELPINHTILDGIKTIQNAFDGDLETLIKSDRVNPLILELIFPEAADLGGVDLSVGSERVKILVEIELDEGSTQEFMVEAEEGNQNKTVPVRFGGQLPVSRLRIEINDVDAAQDSFVHLWEVTLH